MTERQRLYFFDNLRVVAMMLVIAHHAAQPYGPTGGSWPVMNPTRAAVLGPFFTVNRSFGMSLFFMIAGYFTVMSCDRSRPRAFLKNRLLRLGIPLLCFGLVMMALQVFVFGAKDGNLGSPWPVDVGPLWFVEHLLVYSLAYGLWCLARPRRAGAPQEPARVPGTLAILAAVLGLAIVSAVVRIWFWIDEWVYIGGFLRVAPADVPRDTALFLLGAVAYRQQWVTRFSTRAGLAWLGAGLALAAWRYVWELWLQSLLPVREPYLGSIYTLWESLLCVAMCIGLTVLFRERANIRTRHLKWLAQAQYAAYIIHVFPVLGFQLLVAGLAAGPLVKFALVTAAAIPLSFGIGGLIRKPLRL